MFFTLAECIFWYIDPKFIVFEPASRYFLIAFSIVLAFSLLLTQQLLLESILAIVQDVTCGATLPLIAMRFPLKNANLSCGFQSPGDTVFHSSTDFIHSFLWL